MPPNTPDVATHMEDLAWQYPAEAVERAACRFCEAVARWRGKPELETVRLIILTFLVSIFNSPRIFNLSLYVAVPLQT